MIKPVISFITSAVLFISDVPFCAAAESGTETYTINFLDLDGKPYYTIYVPAGQQIDKQVIGQIDTSKFFKQIDSKTQQKFNDWWGIPEYVTENVDIKPLTVTASISCRNCPSRRKYYSKESDISKDGLLVQITFVTQTGIDKDGNYITETDVKDITSTCTIKPETTADAFKSSDKADVKIFPINSNQPIDSFEITYIEGIGDLNGDKIVTGTDAALSLREYTMLSSYPDYKLDASVLKYGDMNFDGILSGTDATLLLRYYTLLSSYRDYNLDKFYEESGIENALS